jgi:hypothetical protein
LLPKATVLGGAVKEIGNVIVYKSQSEKYRNDTGETEIIIWLQPPQLSRVSSLILYMTMTVAYAIDVNGALITFRTSECCDYIEKVYMVRQQQKLKRRTLLTEMFLLRFPAKIRFMFTTRV